MRHSYRDLKPIATLRSLLTAAAAGVLLLLPGCASTGGSPASVAQPPKNIIIMLGDGAAPTQWDFGRHLLRLIDGN